MDAIDDSDLRRLIVDLRSAPTRLQAGVRTVVAKTAFDVVADAQQLVPVDTGNLRSSIGADVDPDGRGFEAGPTASYGAYVEYGVEGSATGDHPPRPYMSPAFDRRVPNAVAALEQLGGTLL